LSKSDWTGKVFDTSKIQLIVFKRGPRPKMGVLLDDTMLMLDYKTFTSYRIKNGNLCFEKGMEAFSSNNKLDYDYLESYFRRNNDNPYALFHPINCITRRNRK
jgi:hypothetical protein